MSNETEIIIVDAGDDYWDTYPQFYLVDGAVTLSGAESVLSSSRLNSRHDVISPKLTGLSTSADVNDGRNNLYSPEIKSVAPNAVWADNAYNSVMSDEANLAFSLTVTDCEHDCYAETMGISTDGVVAPDKCYHVTSSEEISSSILLATTESCVIEIFDNMLAQGKPVETSSIDADRGITYILNHPLYINEDDGPLYIIPAFCCNHIEAPSVGALSTKDQLVGFSNGAHVLLSDEIGTMPIVFNVSVNDSTHYMYAEHASPDAVIVMDGTHAVISDYIWGWADSSSNQVMSAEIKPTVGINPRDCTHQIGPTGWPVLGISAQPATCTHYIMTKDTVSVDGCVHTLTSDELAGNVKYRRCNA